MVMVTSTVAVPVPVKSPQLQLRPSFTSSCEPCTCILMIQHAKSTGADFRYRFSLRQPAKSTGALTEIEGNGRN